MTIRRTALRKTRPVLTQIESIRFLSQAKYIHSPLAEVDALVGTTREAWLTSQFALGATESCYTMANNRGPAGITGVWDTNSNAASCAYSYKYLVHTDYLRFRCVEALSEILVVGRSDQNLSQTQLCAWYDNLAQFAFGNFRGLIEKISYSYEMSMYLTYNKNAKASGTRQPDENYAREIMQLFTIGLWELNLDGTRKTTGTLDPSDARYVPGGTAEVPTYVQSDITNLARVFTGIHNSNGDGVTPDGTDWQFTGTGAKNFDTRIPMCYWPAYHETTLSKVALQGRINIAAGTAGPASMTAALNALVNHPSCAPYICGRLIRHLITSNPTPEYVARVAAVFQNDGTGTVGNLREVFRTIFTDQEARAPRENNKISKVWDTARFATSCFGMWPRFTDTFGTLLGSGDQPYPGSNSGGYPFNDAYSFNTFPFSMGDAKSVFGRWPTTYSPQGPLKTAGLIAPELFQYSESNLSDLANQRNLTIHGLANRWFTAGDLTNAIANPTLLVDSWILLFCANDFPAAFRTALINYLVSKAGSMPTDDLKRYYMRSTLWCILHSPYRIVRT